MTPEQLDEMEAKAKRLNYPGVDGVLSLIAAYRSLDMSLDQWQGSHENEVEKRKKAEARVKELELAPFVCAYEQAHADAEGSCVGAFRKLEERLEAAEAVCVKATGFNWPELLRWRRLKGLRP